MSYPGRAERLGKYDSWKSHHLREIESISILEHRRILQCKENRSQPCFVPVETLNGSKTFPPDTPALFSFLWEDTMTLSMLLGIPTFLSTCHSASLFTGSKALVKSTNTIYNSRFFSRTFSATWLREKIILIKLWPAWKPHWDSG